MEAYSPLGKGNGTTLVEPAAIAAEKGVFQPTVRDMFFLTTISWPVKNFLKNCDPVKKKLLTRF